MLIGRQTELDKLEQLLAKVVLGQGGLCVLYGEPGIGKTRVAVEAAERAVERHFVVNWGRASETGGAPAYWPWIELLAPLIETKTPVPARVSALVAGTARTAVGEAMLLDSERERVELFASVFGFLRECAKRGPLLLVFDDLHMADVASLELLAFVVPRLRAARVAVLATSRDVEARAPRIADMVTRIMREGEVLSLVALSKDEVDEAVLSELGTPDLVLSNALFELTQGNPLFLLETLHAVAAKSGRISLAELREIAVSGGVLGLVRGRLAGATPTLRALLDAAAVLGLEIWSPLLVEITGEPTLEVEHGLEAAATRGILVRRGQDRWAFQHVLVREAFYAELTPERRAALHAAATRALAGRVDQGHADELTALAHHAFCALPFGDAVEASRLARRAAERARAQLASDEAMVILNRAVSICDRFGVPDRERAEVALALGWAATEAGEVTRGREFFRAVSQAARKLSDARLLARAALGQGGAYVFGEIREELISALGEALEALGTASDQEDVRLRARLLARLAAALTPSLTTPDEPLALARRALEMAASETDARTRIDVDVGAGAALSAFAPPAERAPVNERLLRDARLVGDRVLELRALTRLVCDHLESGNIPAAVAESTALAAIGEALGHARYRWQAPLIRSMLAMPEGRFDFCEQQVLEAQSLAATAEDESAERCVEMHRFFLLLLAGRSEALREQEAAALRVIGLMADSARRRALISAVTATRTGDHVRARAQLAAVGNAATTSWSRLWRSLTAEAALSCGAREVYEPLCASFSAEQIPLVCSGPFAFACTLPIAYVEGIGAFALGRPDEGVRHCERALLLSRGIGAKAHVAWIELVFGEGLSGKPAAREHLSRALELGEELRMPDVVNRAQAAWKQTAAAAAPGFALPVPVITPSPDGREWSVARAGRELRLKSVRGLAMLRRLLENPNREIHALELAVEAAPASQSFDVGDAGPMLDPRAREEYRARLAALRSELDEAEAFQDQGRAERIREESAALTQELARALGLGRERRAGSAAERARIVVQRRVREAIKKIADEDAELGRYLNWTVRTGTYCAYEPDGRKAR